jgi:hypothetical protein
MAGYGFHEKVSLSHASEAVGQIAAAGSGFDLYLTPSDTKRFPGTEKCTSQSLPPKTRVRMRGSLNVVSCSIVICGKS